MDRTQHEPRQTGSFFAVAYAFFVIMVGTTLPTPLYALYQSQFGFSALMITVLFAVYAAVVVVTLLVFGRLSDDIGRKPVLLMAALMALLSAACFLLADGVPLLMVGRVLSGVSAGLVTGTATATLLDLGGTANRGRSATLAVAFNAGGLAGGTTLSGFLAEWLPNPLFLPFFVDLALTALAVVALLLFRSPAPTQRKLRVRVQKPTVPAEVRSVFARSAIAAGCGFAVTGVLTAVVSVFLVTKLHIDNHALAGAVVGMALANVAVGQVLVDKMSERSAIAVGSVGLIVSSVLIAWALLATLLAPLIVGSVLVGLSTGLCTGAGLRSIGTRAPAENRGAVSSTFFAVLYTMLSLPAVAVGLLETVTDLVTAGVTFSAVVALLALGTLVSLKSSPAEA